MTRSLRSDGALRLGGAVIAMLLAGCGSETLRSWLDDATPHERYEQSLLDAGLDLTALGRDWIAAASASVAGAASVPTPYHEQSYLDPRAAAAWGYRVRARRGQWLSVAFVSAPDSAYRVFLDLFQVPADSGDRVRHLAAADSATRTLEYYVRRDGEYVIRVQPELLRGGRYGVTITTGPSLRFPVEGHDTTAIRSWYGNPRDGGRRRHEGLDIFAPRGTPVLAAADGIVRSTRPNNLGGVVVWVRDTLERSHYYAHLDTQVVRRGQPVRVGDTLGYVGNSGNARTTPTHLHFGLYARGSFDPYPALQQPAPPPAFAGDAGLIGTVARARLDGTQVRQRPTRRSATVVEVARHTPMRVDAGTGEWFRVTLPDGTPGFVPAALTDRLDEPVRRTVVVQGGDLLAQPHGSATPLAIVAPGTEVGVHGSFGPYVYVTDPHGRSGWMTLQ